MISKVEVTFTKVDIENLLREAAPKEIHADSGYYWSPKNTTWEANGNVVIELEKKSISTSYWDR